MKIKRITAALISVVMAFTAVNITAAAAETESSSEVTASLAPEELSPALNTAEINSLPSRFDLREKGLVSAVKNQGNFGTCWTFAASGALETDLIRNEPFADLSELHLAYFSFFGDDTPSNPENDPEAFISGGHISYAAASYARWTGPVREALLPYSTSKEDIDESLKNRSEYFVTDVNIINPYSLKDTDSGAMLRFSDEEIKQMLIDEHAVAVNIRYENTCNMKTFGQYDPTKGKTNHGVLIVGWDDSYSRDNFLATPPGDGAWIVKNSWGDSWGDDGYFYVSYYDGSLSDACCMNVEKAGRYQTNYQHDTLFYTAAVSPDHINKNTGYMANIFTAEKDEYISGAGFYTTDNNAEYEITVYSGLTNDSDPVSGTAGVTQKGREKFAGYHTVSLDNPVRVQKGEKFSVVCRLTNPDTYSPVPVEAAVVLMENWYSSNVSDISTEEISSHSSAGESFISSNGTRWTDTKDMKIEQVYNNPSIPDTNVMYYIGNVCLKAFGSENPGEILPEERKKSVLSSLTVNRVPLKVSDESDNPVTELSTEISDTRDYAVFFPTGTGKITINGTETVSGHRSERVPLDYGNNVIKVTSSEDGMEDTEYTVTVRRNRVSTDYFSETIFFDEDTTSVVSSDGHSFRNGDSISDWLGEELQVTEPDREYTYTLTPRRDLAEAAGSNALMTGSEGIAGLFSFKGDMVFSSSPDMSNPSDIHNRQASMLGESYFRVYPGYDTDLYFQILASDTAPKSTVFHVNVPPRPVIDESMVDIEILSETSFAFTMKNGGKRTEYKTAVKYTNDTPDSSLMYGAEEVTDGVNTVTDLIPGQTYSLYLKTFSDRENFSTDITEFTVRMPGKNEMCSFNYEKERIIFDDSLWSVRACDGKELRCFDLISEYTGTEAVFTDNDGNETAVLIPARRAAPEHGFDFETGVLTGTFGEAEKFVTGNERPYSAAPSDTSVIAGKDGIITMDEIFSSFYRAGNVLHFFYAASENEFASEMCSITVPAQDSIPESMITVLSYTTDTVTLQAHEGVEYGYRTSFRNQFTWQDEPVITGLKPGRKCILAVRYKATNEKPYSRCVYDIVTTLPEDHLSGDMNDDGAVNAMDALILRRIILNDTFADAFQHRNADMNEDSRVNILDFQRLVSEIMLC